MSMKRITAEHLISSYDETHEPCDEVNLEEAFTIETHDREGDALLTSVTR